MHASPRLRRLSNDLLALERLRSESSVFSFTAQGNPPHHYIVTFKGRSLWRDRGQVRPLELHRVEIKLGASYPRTIPEIRWITPIYHPNISEIGLVCLGGYGTHWVPSVQLDELCTMLWDMARYHNYDIRSPYNRDSAAWAANQVVLTFPTDTRPLRDLRVAQGRIAPSTNPAKNPPQTRDETSQTVGLTRVRRFSHLYGAIFGGREHAEIQLAPVESNIKRTTPYQDSPHEADANTNLTTDDTTPIACTTSQIDEASSSSHADLVFLDVQNVGESERPNSLGGDEEILFIG